MSSRLPLHRATWEPGGLEAASLLSRGARPPRLLAASLRSPLVAAAGCFQSRLSPSLIRSYAPPCRFERQRHRPTSRCESRLSPPTSRERSEWRVALGVGPQRFEN